MNPLAALGALVITALVILGVIHVLKAISPAKPKTNQTIGKTRK